ncbi:hypothetical protein [Galenea microaerophila]
MTTPNAPSKKETQGKTPKPASFLFWKIQSELSKTESQLAKLHEDIKEVQQKIEQKQKKASKA